ncbi:MAG: YkgJ family cysteine cluster protein [Desulfotomaculum sp.]|nr:YkgJ family cysteine cluster protein [Desulfotomaculum sp.]
MAAYTFSAEEKFKFSCHPGLECFNTCCRDINIFLTPYDVLRLKNSLKMYSQDFLARYARVIDTGSWSFPLVIIKMNEDDDRKCPFVTENGCRVYEDRPWSCRMAPVDIRGENLYGFCFDSSFCRGLDEDREWTADEWAKNQGADVYEKMDSAFKEIPSKLKFTGLPSIDKHIKKMFFMASYDLDSFRQYIFNSSFIEKFSVPADVVEKIKNDDVELMKFGIEWLMNLDIRKSMEIRDEVAG